jgi:hypothetical protein
MNPTDTAEVEAEKTADAGLAFLEYFRCLPEFAAFEVVHSSPLREGFFRCGTATCFGKTEASACSDTPDDVHFDVLSAVDVSREGEIRLLFNPTEVIENLRRERYFTTSSREHLLHTLYYLIRPIFPFPPRKLLQRYVFLRRRAAKFPSWPIDCSVELICESLMQLAIRAARVKELPFIWFWPEGKHAAIMVTHDVEQRGGAELCDMLMDMDNALDIKASFQVIPEGRYSGVENLVATIRARGFEANVHDLDHNGRLYEDRKLFEKRAQKINEYARFYAMRGFRAGAMHRNQNWFGLLDFQYEMSVPTVSQLEPQRGGCCTVMPYFVGGLLELPLTTTQDHSLFYILGEHSIDLWKQQIGIISSHHGLISFIVHPDYLAKKKERSVYRELLEYLSQQRRDQNMWLAFPGEINDWWRKRSNMTLRRENGSWRISGEGSETARIAYASVVNGRLEYRIAN